MSSARTGTLGAISGFVVGFVVGIVLFEGGPGFEPAILVSGIVGAVLGGACASLAARRLEASEDPR